MTIHTYGANAVDWEQRVDYPRLRAERLARAREALAASDDDRVHHKAVFVDEIVFRERLRELTTSVDKDILTRLLFEARNLLHKVTVEQCRVIPRELVEGL